MKERKSFQFQAPGYVVSKDYESKCRKVIFTCDSIEFFEQFSVQHFWFPFKLNCLRSKWLSIEFFGCKDFCRLELFLFSRLLILFGLQNCTSNARAFLEQEQDIFSTLCSSCCQNSKDNCTLSEKNKTEIEIQYRNTS